MSLTVLVADDHPVFREGLQVTLEDSPGIDVVGAVADGQAALEQREAHPPRRRAHGPAHAGRGRDRGHRQRSPPSSPRPRSSC